MGLWVRDKKLDCPWYGRGGGWGDVGMEGKLISPLVPKVSWGNMEQSKSILQCFCTTEEGTEEVSIIDFFVCLYVHIH